MPKLNAAAHTLETAAAPVDLHTALHSLLLHAPIVFSGQVLPSPPPLSRLIGDEIIRVRVDHGLRGVQDGQVFVFRSWRSSNRPMPPSGQRIILFLHQPNAAGYTSSAIASLQPILITGSGTVDIRQLLLLQRQLAPLGPNAADESACLAPPFQSAATGIQQPQAAGLFPCRRSTRSRPPMHGTETMTEPQFFALLRQALVASPTPAMAFHAP